MNASQVLLILSVWSLVGCDTNDTHTPAEREIPLTDSSRIASEMGVSENPSLIDTLVVIVVPCANGYEYATYNFDFNPVIEAGLDAFESIRVKPFPYKTLMGVAYHGVFDKRYCPPIIEKVDVDFLVLTRFDKELYEAQGPGMKWGYEVKVVNAATLEQVRSIQAHDLGSYEEIEQHIAGNIGQLKADMEGIR